MRLGGQADNLFRFQPIERCADQLGGIDNLFDGGQQTDQRPGAILGARFARRLLGLIASSRTFTEAFIYGGGKRRRCEGFGQETICSSFQAGKSRFTDRETRHQDKRDGADLRIAAHSVEDEIASDALQLDPAQDQVGQLSSRHLNTLGARPGLENLEPLLLQRYR